MRLSLLLCLALACTGCPESLSTPRPAKTGKTGSKSASAKSASAKSASAKSGAESAAKTATPSEARVYEVACGCALPEVGKCSEWAKHEGAWVSLKGHGMGSMPFCGKKGLKAKIAGKVEGKTLTASSVELVK